MSFAKMSGSQGLKAVLAVASLASTPVWADQASLLSAPEPRRPQSNFLVEVQPPALDGSVYGLRVEVTPFQELPFTFGVLRRVGSWSGALGTPARFSGTDVGSAKLDFAVGAEGRYALGSFANGTVSPFIGLTAGLEQFEVRSKLDATGHSYSNGLFLEPAVGLTYRPGAGHFGLLARVGPGFSSSNAPEHSFDGGTLRLRSVYPTASLGLLLAL